MNFGTFAAFMITAGLAIARISHILLDGSIFQSLRDFIKDEAENEEYTTKWLYAWGVIPCYSVSERLKFRSWFFGKAQQLFTCDLCMTTQVGLWFAAAPFAWYYFGHMPKWVLVPWAIFMVAMATSALAKGLLYRLEYPKNFLEEIARQANQSNAEQERQFDEQLDLIRELERRKATQRQREEAGTGRNPFEALISVLAGGQSRSPFSRGSGFGGFDFNESPSGMFSDPFGLEDGGFSFGDEFEEPRHQMVPGAIPLGEFRRLLREMFLPYQHVSCSIARGFARNAEIGKWASKTGADGNAQYAMEEILKAYERAAGSGRVPNETTIALYKRYLADVHPLINAVAARR